MATGQAKRAEPTVCLAVFSPEANLDNVKNDGAILPDLDDCLKLVVTVVCVCVCVYVSRVCRVCRG